MPIAALLAAVLLYLALAGFPLSTERSEEIKLALAAELPVGAPREAIESFLERHEIAYSWDRFSGRYQGIIRDESPYAWVDQAVSIYIYVDDENRHMRSEVVDTVTSF